MADGAQPIGTRLGSAPGWLAAALILVLTLGTLAAVLARADAPARLGASDWAAIRFTLWQAALSALFSVALAVPVARALARRHFPGRGLLVTLLGAPFILPVIVAILGLIAVFGQNGALSWLLGLVGLPPVDIYGLHGVVLAHVFFNLPLATRLILQGWLSIPAERVRLAASLGFSPADVQRHLEWPMLRGILPGITLVVFLICTTSFAVALTLGGGPRATTVELAIYQAFRFDFDLGRAALLGLVQVAIAGTAAALAYVVTRVEDTTPALDRPAMAWRTGPGLRALDIAVIALAALFLIAPLLAVVLRGVPGLLDLPPSVFVALGRSLAVAVVSTLLTLALALSLGLWAIRARFGGGVEALGYLSIAASPLVVGTGLFILLFPIVDPIALALPVTAVVNALMALPFAMRALMPPLREAHRDYGRLAASLGLTGLARLRIAILPRLARPMGFAAGLTAALSMGDLGVVALFADPSQGTLPLEMYRLMGAYRMEQAAGAGLLLLIAALGAFWLCDRGGRIRAGA